MIVNKPRVVLSFYYFSYWNLLKEKHNKKSSKSCHRERRFFLRGDFNVIAGFCVIDKLIDWLRESEGDWVKKKKSNWRVFTVWLARSHCTARRPLVNDDVTKHESWGIISTTVEIENKSSLFFSITTIKSIKCIKEREEEDTHSFAVECRESENRKKKRERESRGKKRWV